MKNKKPIIGLIADFNQGKDGSYSRRPFYAIRKNHIDVLGDEALSIIIPYQHQAIQDYVDLIDGLIVIGGFFDINPERYSEKKLNDSLIFNEIRENFEFEFIKKFLPTQKPIMGICGGMQAINVVLGGNLIQDIATQKKQAMQHEQSKIAGFQDPHLPFHDIEIQKDNKLFNLSQKTRVKVNSFHHQAIKNLAKNLKATAFADDGIIEAFEHENHPFCMGLQWHPEYKSCEIDENIFKEFVKKCQK